ncbi:MAG: glycosyltransferase [Gemmatimonadetes bacterium]|nr:glycosyltransferase [Gemmatimonadota bacterium]
MVPDAGGRVSRVRVLFFTSALGGGGAEKHLVRVANGLDRARFDVSVAVARGGGSYERELAGDVRLHALARRGMAASVLPLRALIARERPDVVCSVMDHANCAALAATAAMRSAPPVVACVQIPARIELGRTKRPTARALLAAIPRLYPRAARIVALSEGVRRDLAEFVPRAAPRITVIYNAGYDEAVLRLAGEDEGPVPPAGEGPVIVACGRLTEQKGFHDLLRAFARVREKTPARLWIVGEGHLRASLEAEAERLGIAPHVWFAGFQGNPYRLMARADVFALSSLWEGFGNVVVEAMAVGTPVVATRCPHGPDEIVTDGRDGVLVPVGDDQAMAGALLRVLGDAELRARLSAAGRVRAEDFAAPRIAGAYGDVLEAAAGVPRLAAA